MYCAADEVWGRGAFCLHDSRATIQVSRLEAVQGVGSGGGRAEAEAMRVLDTTALLAAGRWRVGPTLASDALLDAPVHPVARTIASPTHDDPRHRHHAESRAGPSDHPSPRRRSAAGILAQSPRRATLWGPGTSTSTSTPGVGERPNLRAPEVPTAQTPKSASTFPRSCRSTADAKPPSVRFAAWSLLHALPRPPPAVGPSAPSFALQTPQTQTQSALYEL
ncbi:hypothetical protein P171DRAFT_450103 [Karstenula rhodostoma CBS 690.94]|uniref:Uncharacterized protein n=1 Tax=Karstenula rhodostoma CBS 690.94 TaxID=1392251 RepID=A0A9P4P5K8_9PLEO|nr:hypothetical protein P171DRAFT_450103 [Karstenula rhodostoma CBS 690.94]